MSVYDVILKNRAFMLSHLEPTYIIEQLYSKEVISEQEYQNIKVKKTAREQCVAILNYVGKCTENQFFDFCDVLNDDFDWVGEQVLSDGNEAGLKRSSKSG